MLFAPLALFRPIRPWIWTLGIALHLGLIVLIDFADLSLGMVMLHLFTFDPGWLLRNSSRDELAQVRPPTHAFVTPL